MNTKEKTKRGGFRRSYPVEFIVPLQLEECLYHINHQPRGKMPLQVVTESSKDGRVYFIVWLDQDICARGELRRWEGTATQVSGQLDTWLIPTRLKWVWTWLDPLMLWGMVLLLPAFAVVSMLIILDLTRSNHLFLPDGLLMVIWLGCQLLFCFLMTGLPRLLRRRTVVMWLKRILTGTEKY